MLADYHTLIHLDARANEQLAALLGTVQAKSGRHTRLGRNQRTVGAGVELTTERLVAHEQRVDNPLTARGGQEGLAEAQQAARRHVEDHMDSAIVTVAHI